LYEYTGLIVHPSLFFLFSSDNEPVTHPCLLFVLDQRIVQPFETAGKAIQLRSVGTSGEDKDNKEARKRFSSTALLSQEGHHAIAKVYSDSRAVRRELLAAEYGTQSTCVSGMSGRKPSLGGNLSNCHLHTANRLAGLKLGMPGTRRLLICLLFLILTPHMWTGTKAPNNHQESKQTYTPFSKHQDAFTELN
jgi:hypothetical protein